MGIAKAKSKVTKNKQRKSIKKVALTKKQKIAKRASRMQKLIQYRKKLKRSQKGKVVPIKKKKLMEAEKEIIDYSTKKDTINVNDQSEINILDILGLNTPQNRHESTMKEENQWEKVLEHKLKEANDKSLDNPEVRRVYGEIGRIFATYRSGKIPRAFKIIPNLQKWEQVLMITRPDNWTPQAMYQAVNIFASNFDANRAQQFYQKFLVPAIKADLQKNKKLNYHYYQCLKKGLYKTNAWFRGILFHFCSSHTLSKQIAVMQSLLSKMSIPVISSSVAIIKLTQMQPCTAIFHYLKCLVNKSYNFPRKVINIFCNYIKKIFEMSKQKQLPVVWHQFVLIYCRQYGNNLDEMQQSHLGQIVKMNPHKAITPEIIREIQA